MNLFLTNQCNESCSFCYAEDYFKGTPKGDRKQYEVTVESLRAYAALVKAHGDLPLHDPDHDELTRSYYAASCVNLLGGEPSVHPFFDEVVTLIREELKLGVIVFTNGGFPKKIAKLKDRVWSVTINGHFAERAPKMGFEMHRVFANLPVRPTDDIIARLTVIRDAGIKGMFMAFATPAGSARDAAFTPDDLVRMKEVHAKALEFCAANEIYLGYDCSFPLCVDERVGQTKCSSVPVMDAQGHISICGGDYYYNSAKRHVSTFATLDELHAYTMAVQTGLRGLPSEFDVCNKCEHFNKACNGMCLSYRVKPAKFDEGVAAAAAAASTIKAPSAA